MSANDFIADQRVVEDVTRKAMLHFRLPEGDQGQTIDGEWYPPGLHINSDCEMRDVVEVVLREAKVIT